MNKASSPLLGFNNNVRHKDRVFHIQTEDSGLRRPHVITHLFYDGGRILKSVKTSYADRVDDPGVMDHVRSLMKAQHKAMFVALRGGEYDELIDAAEGRPSFAPPPLRPSEVPPPRAPMPSTPAIQFADEAAPTMAEGASGLAPGELSRDTAPEVVVEYDALERAAAEIDEASVRTTSDLPPPPPAARRDSSAPLGTGRYFAAVAREQSDRASSRRDPRVDPSTSPPPVTRASSVPPIPAAPRAPSIPAARASRPPPMPSAPRAPSVPPPSFGSRPASIPAAPRAPSVPPIPGASRPPSIPPPPRAPTVVVRPRGTDADRSLDDIIYAYLAEDFDSDKQK